MTRIELSFKVHRQICACGADLKGAFAFAKGSTAWLIDGFGDLQDIRNLDSYERSFKRYAKKLNIKIESIACDMHPGYFSTRFAKNLRAIPASPRIGRNLRFCDIQHHEAHIASAMADNGLRGKIIGVAFDGTGLGADGKIWGGEFFVGGMSGFKRAAHFEYVPIPGGEAAIREPWRMASSYMYRTFGPDFLEKAGKRDRAILIKKMIDKGINSPLTSSVGRLFDAAGSLILGREISKFEAELPMELEKMVPEGYDEHYEFDISDEPGISVIGIGKIFKGIARDLSRGLDRRLLSGKFHNTVAGIIISMATALGRRYGLDRAILSGGVFQNKYLSARARSGLENNGFRVYGHSKVSTTDAGIPLGQIAIANARPSCA